MLTITLVAAFAAGCLLPGVEVCEDGHGNMYILDDCRPGWPHVCWAGEFGQADPGVSVCCDDLDSCIRVLEYGECPASHPDHVCDFH